MLCLTRRARCSPTAHIEARLSERPCASREAPCASPSPACGAGMRPKRRRALRLGISRSTAFVAASRRSLERGSAAMAFGACDGEDWRRPVCRSASPQSCTTSSAVPGFSPRPDDTAKRRRKNQATSRPFLMPTNRRKRRPAHRSPSSCPGGSMGRSSRDRRMSPGRPPCKVRGRSRPAPVTPTSP